jgi:glycosyltransferase involved in cell wall biosynthesis
LVNKPQKLAVIVLTLNEERNLPDCLASVRTLPCELYVIDSGSTDRTVSLARNAGASVLSHPFENYALQRNWGLANVPSACEWVLNLDADERLTPELAEEIRETLESPPADIDGYVLRRRTVFMGRWIRHGGHYPNHQLRLFRRSRGLCEERRYDQHFVVQGATAFLKNDYVDIVASDIVTWSGRHVKWAAAEADELLSGEHSSDASAPRVRANILSGPIGRRRWLREKFYGRAPLFSRALGYWTYRYFIRLGFLDGREGLVFHFLQGFWFRFLIDAITWDRRSDQRVSSAVQADA